MKWERKDFLGDAVTTARKLIGAVVVRRSPEGVTAGRIVECEAYGETYEGHKDDGAHVFKGLTPRTKIIFGEGGYAYVYLIYGMHHCMNVVTGPEGSGTAVLLRALEPEGELPHASNGPGRLCKAMGIDRRHYGHDLCSADLFIAAAPAVDAADIVVRPRIGVDYAGEWALKPLRFYVAGNRFVSRP